MRYHEIIYPLIQKIKIEDKKKFKTFIGKYLSWTKKILFKDETFEPYLGIIDKLYARYIPVPHNSVYFKDFCCYLLGLTIIYFKASYDEPQNWAVSFFIILNNPATDLQKEISEYQADFPSEKNNLFKSNIKYNKILANANFIVHLERLVLKEIDYKININLTRIKIIFENLASREFLNDFLEQSILNALYFKTQGDYGKIIDCIKEFSGDLFLQNIFPTDLNDNIDGSFAYLIRLLYKKIERNQGKEILHRPTVINIYFALNIFLKGVLVDLKTMPESKIILRNLVEFALKLQIATHCYFLAPTQEACVEFEFNCWPIIQTFIKDYGNFFPTQHLNNLRKLCLAVLNIYRKTAFYPYELDKDSLFVLQINQLKEEVEVLKKTNGEEPQKIISIAQELIKELNEVVEFYFQNRINATYVLFKIFCENALNKAKNSLEKNCRALSIPDSSSNFNLDISTLSIKGEQRRFVFFPPKSLLFNNKLNQLSNMIETVTPPPVSSRPMGANV